MAITYASIINRIGTRITGAGLHNMIAGVAGYRIVVIGLVMSANGTGQITIQDTDGNPVIDFYCVAGTPFVLPPNELGWFAAPTGLGLDALFAAAITAGGTLAYRLVPDHIAW